MSLRSLRTEGWRNDVACIPQGSDRISSLVLKILRLLPYVAMTDGVFY
ncbi:hypothetical protein [Calothrix sp. PCC 6303]|nr:hypothetical protein [Calothrix sp. PCC 6303]